MRRILDIKSRLSLPAIAAPMFLVSGPDLVIECCKAGIIGSFPTLNARPIEVLGQWFERIVRELAAAESASPGRIAPWAANVIVHRSNARFAQDLDLVVKYQAPIVISALGSPQACLSAVHSYGGLVFADVSTVEFARKAADAGADGLVLVAAGAGGHTGDITGFSLLPAVREFFAGPIVLGGGISSGRAVRAAEVLGADFAYLGTRFIATRESLASDDYRQMIVDAATRDIVKTAHFTGIPANYLRRSIELAGIDPADLATPGAVVNVDDEEKRGKAWKDIWSAGQGVWATRRVESVAELVSQLKGEYDDAVANPVRHVG
jgi:nitronate monooxygenase